MPPKKDAKKEILINGVNLYDFNREGLEVFVLTLLEELERKREERNVFQVERDELSASWEACRLRINDLELKIRITDREGEEFIEQAREAELFQRQKGKYELYENKILSDEYLDEFNAMLKQERLQHSQNLARINKEKGELKDKIIQQEAAFYDELKKLKASQKDEMEKTQKHYDERFHQLQKEAVERQDYLLKKLEVYQIDTAEVEERLNKHLDILVNSHEESFECLKAFYNEQTTTSLGVINGLLTELDLLKNRINSLNASQKMYQSMFDKKNIEYKEMLDELLFAKKRRDNCNRLKTALDNKEIQLKRLEGENDHVMKTTIAIEAKVKESINDRRALQRNIAKKLKL